MRQKRYLLFVVLPIAAFLVFAGLAFGAKEDKEIKKKQELLQRLEELRQKKDEIKRKEQEKISQIDTKNQQGRAESIALFERVITTAGRDDPRRADALFQLGALYYEKEQEDFITAQNQYEKLYQRWQKMGGVDAGPVAPVPDYSKSINAFKTLVLEFPIYKSRDVALYKLGNIFTSLGDFESAFESFNEMVKKYPNSDNIAFAYLRIGEYYFTILRDNENALKSYKNVPLTAGADNYMLALYRIASCYYNMGNFEDAISRFFEYVELADSGKFKGAILRNEAVEFLAISFSELEGGAEKALEFFDKMGGRPYQDLVIYTVGLKNRDHDNVSEAIKSLNFLLKHSPNYIDAPVAIKALIDCYIIEKEYETANNLRERMMKDYGPGSMWEKSYANYPEKVAKAKEYIQEAAAIIPIYYHKLYMIRKDSGQVKEALQYGLKAIDGYKTYVSRFPSEKWNAYTFHYFLAELLSDSLMDRWEEAATEYDWVSREDTTKYPDRSKAAEELLEKKKKEARDIKDQGRSDIREEVRTIAVNPEEAGFAAVICYDHIMQKALKARGLSDTTVGNQGFALPETQAYLNYIRDFRNRFPASKHSAEVAFLESNLYFNAKEFNKSLEGYQYIVEKFPDHEKIFRPSLENLAKSYLNAGKFEDAINTYKRLYHTTNPTSLDEKKKLLESICAAMFQLAQSKQKEADYSGAADIFKRIVLDYPDFSNADKSLFNGANAYQEGKMYEEAAREFERVFDKFTESKLRKDALLRAAKNYEDGQQYIMAARIFLKFKDAFPADAEAVPSMFRAADMYDKAEDLLMSAKVYEQVYDAFLENKKDKTRFVGAEKEAPGALYNAGRIYEKAKRYEDAIGLYNKLKKDFPQSEYTAEAVFSIALCYEKLNDNKKIAESYIDYAKGFASDRSRVVFALYKASKSFQAMGDRVEEEKMYRNIIDIHAKDGEKFGIDPQYAAEADYILGERAFEQYAKLDLFTSKKGKDGMKEIETKLKAKNDAITVPLKFFTDCIALQTDKWTTHATFMCGEIFWNLMEAVKNQPIIEKDQFKAAYAKVKINEALPPYYEKAANYYKINVEKFGNTMGIDNEWVQQSKDKYAQCWYQVGFSHIENGQIFSAAPIPFPKGTQEYDEYKLQIDEMVKKLTEKCTPVFETGIKECAAIYVNNSWVERMRKELEVRDPQNQAISIVIGEPPKPQQQTAASGQGSGVAVGGFSDQAFERSLKAIGTIYQDNSIPIMEKISILRGLEESAKREMERLAEEIRELKGR